MSEPGTRPPRRVAVVGCGTMGRGIALTFARAGIPCAVVDTDEQSTREGRRRIATEAQAASEGGLLSGAEVAAVESGLESTWPIERAVSDCDLVVEAVIEEIQAKRGVYEQVEAAADDGTVIATNTSAIPIAHLAAALRRPQRFLGTHWFNPAPWVPGLEVIRGPDTDEEVVDRVLEIHRGLGKRPVVVPDRPGFVANRIQAAMLAEAARILAEGGISAADIDEVVRSSFGLRLPIYGPFTLADLAGLEVYAAVFSTLERGLGERFEAPPGLVELVEAGHLGSKSGQGFLSWSPARVATETGRRDVALAQIDNVLRGGQDR